MEVVVDTSVPEIQVPSAGSKPSEVESSSTSSIAEVQDPTLTSEVKEVIPMTHEEDADMKEDDCKDDGEYMLRWSEHNTQLIHVFHQLCQADELTDVTIATEGHQFKAHKLILSACSPYFRQLFLATPCKHPVVFIKDISDDHMRLLLEYMYRGSIAVKQYELEEVLSAASVLKIRGLTTATLPPDLPAAASGAPTTTTSAFQLQRPTTTTSSEDEEAPLIVDESVGGGGDKFHHVETSSSISGKSGSLGRKAEGRKSSVPKKLRLSSSDREDLVDVHSPPRHPQHLPQHTTAAAVAAAAAGNPWFMQKPIGESDLRTSPLLLGGGSIVGRPICSRGGSSGDNRSPVDTLTDNEEIDADQPVDFSTTNSSSGGGNKIDLAPRYSILGSYLKTGLPGLDASGMLDQHKRNELAEDLRRAGYGGQAATWLGLEHLTTAGLTTKLQHRPASRDSRGDSREERNSSGEDIDKDSKGTTPPPLAPLTDTLGIDIAGRLRSHFLANLPSQSYAWLNGMSNGNMSSLNSLASMSQLGAMGSLSGLSSLASSIPPTKEGGGGGVGGGSNRARRGSSDKVDKHPVGGVRTGEIGANGKPAVACEVCGKKLADPSSLYRHRKIHSGDKPHKCPYCPRRFIQRYNMKQHIKTHRIELMADQTTTLPSTDSSSFVEHEAHNITT